MPHLSNDCNGISHTFSAHNVDMQATDSVAFCLNFNNVDDEYHLMFLYVHVTMKFKKENEINYKVFYVKLTLHVYHKLLQ